MRHITDRIDHSSTPDLLKVTVRWAPLKSLIWTIATLGWIIGGTVYFSWQAVGVFILSCIITLCGGHSIGMHRKLIHDSFDCSKNLERIGVYLGTLVGLGGPFTMMRSYDFRDWAQQQTECHPYFSHGSSPLKDFWWQVHCRADFAANKNFRFPEKLTQDHFMIGLQRTAYIQHIVLGIGLWTLGGWGFVFWGLCGRVSMSIFGHWAVGYIAHNRGHQDWIVAGAAVQGHNVRFCGLITFGECWHNNHHAFPESAKLGIYKGQLDPGWWTLRVFEQFGLVSNLVLPEDLPPRDSLKAVQ